MFPVCKGWSMFFEGKLKQLGKQKNMVRNLPWTPMTVVLQGLYSFICFLFVIFPSCLNVMECNFNWTLCCSVSFLNRCSIKLLYLILFSWRKPDDILHKATAKAWLGEGISLFLRENCVVWAQLYCMKENSKWNKEHAPSKPKKYEKCCALLFSITLLVSSDFNVPTSSVHSVRKTSMK